MGKSIALGKGRGTVLASLQGPNQQAGTDDDAGDE